MKKKETNVRKAIVQQLSIEDKMKIRGGNGQNGNTPKPKPTPKPADKPK